MSILQKLIEELQCLPGVGPKSAQRMVFYLLQYKRSQGLALADSMAKVLERVRPCRKCNHYTEEDICFICQDIKRDKSTLCIVESSADLIAIEQSQVYNGKYFVLMGKISPLDGIGPEDIGILQIQKLTSQQKVKEVIFALSPTVEAQTTIHFILEILTDSNLKISQLAQGIPSCGELGYLDTNTISNALRNRCLVVEST